MSCKEGKCYRLAIRREKKKNYRVVEVRVSEDGPVVGVVKVVESDVDVVEDMNVEGGEDDEDEAEDVGEEEGARGAVVGRAVGEDAGRAAPVLDAAAVESVTAGLEAEAEDMVRTKVA